MYACDSSLLRGLGRCLPKLHGIGFAQPCQVTEPGFLSKHGNLHTLWGPQLLGSWFSWSLAFYFGFYFPPAAYLPSLQPVFRFQACLRALHLGKMYIYSIALPSFL